MVRSRKWRLLRIDDKRKSRMQKRKMDFYGIGIAGADGREPIAREAT